MRTDPQALEAAARTALAERYGHDLTNEEWAQAKYALLELGKIMRDWNQEAASQPEKELAVSTNS